LGEDAELADLGDDDDEVGDEAELEDLDPFSFLTALALGYLYQLITPISKRRTARTTK